MTAFFTSRVQESGSPELAKPRVRREPMENHDIQAPGDGFRELYIWWMWRRAKRMAVIMLIALIVSVYVYSGKPKVASSFGYGKPTDSAGVVNLSTLNKTIWKSLSDDTEPEVGCFYRRWTHIVNNLAVQLPSQAREHLKGRMTAEAKKDVEKLVKRLGDKCREFLEAGHMTHPYVMSVFKSDPELDDTVTFVTQLGQNRWDRMELILDSWNAAISVSVYLLPHDIPSFLMKLCRQKRLVSRKNVDLHIVLKDGIYYPINFLRNVALNGTKTPLSYLSDADFIPQKGTDDVIKRFWIQNQTFFDKNVLVVPAFEVLKENVSIPKNKQEVIQLWDEGLVIPAREHKWPRGHLPTNYDKWRQHMEVYPIEYTEDYEPYVVMKTSQVPQFSRLFVERFRDKASQLLEVWAKGFNFYVIGSVFTVHYPHNRSAISSFKNLFECAMSVTDIFYKHIMTKYDISTVPKYI